jgi:hypothetical protein
VVYGANSSNSGGLAGVENAYAARGPTFLRHNYQDDSEVGKEGEQANSEREFDASTPGKRVQYLCYVTDPIDWRTADF